MSLSPRANSCFWTDSVVTRGTFISRWGNELKFPPECSLYSQNFPFVQGLEGVKRTKTIPEMPC